MGRHYVACQSQPCYLGDVGGVVGPCPQAEGPGVIRAQGHVFTAQRTVLDVVQVARSRHCPLGDAFVPRVDGDAFQAEAHVVPEVAVITVGKGPP